MNYEMIEAIEDCFDIWGSSAIDDLDGLFDEDAAREWAKVAFEAQHQFVEAREDEVDEVVNEVVPRIIETARFKGWIERREGVNETKRAT